MRRMVVGMARIGPVKEISGKQNELKHAKLAA